MNVYEGMLSADTDAYLNQLKLQQIQRDRATQAFSESLRQRPAVPSVGEYILQGLAENKARMDRAQKAADESRARDLDRLEREVERMEMQNYIDRANRGR
jgi:hypothetical protein